ncbi:SDR family NAD(P)-dependent oxidoreductase [Streptomyces sp. 4N509B]|uniref:SDR family NAD(P)-dependent oxidoreductase n=1 Tax=Streptomyces sp. 4N509B TaxID=3457413 RepID=UPI003FD00C0D
MRMRDRVAVVTGAARGNGLAIARLLAAEGAHVVMGDLLEAEVREAAEGIAAEGGAATGLACDVSNPDDVERLVAAAEELGGPHAVVAQAGARHEGGIMATTPEQWDHYMSVDVKGTYLCARAAIPRMRRLGGGSIVTMSGTFGVVPEPGIAVQAAGKGAILALTRAIAVEVGPDNIRCNAIVPGYIETPMLDRWANDHPDPAAARKAVTSMHALRRLGSPEEIAAMALFLCSDDSSFSTGHPFPVDGGLSIGMNNIYEFEALRGNTGRGLDA